MKKVLITGAAGGLGTRLRQMLKGAYPNIRLSDLRRPADLAPDETFVEADLASIAEVENAVAGVEGIVLLGRRIVGHDPASQHHRLLQPVRGGASAASRTRGVRLVEPRDRFLSAPP